MIEKTFPYSDVDMTYSHQTHRYTLTADAVRQHLNVDLGTMLNPAGSIDRAGIAPTFLSHVSREVYSYIYACGTDNDLQEYLLAKHPNARRILLDAMLAQVEYMILNGDIYQVSGVDIRKGSAMDRRALRGARVSLEVEDILSRPLDAATPSIVYRGEWSSYPCRLRLPAYESEEY